MNDDEKYVICAVNEDTGERVYVYLKGNDSGFRGSAIPVQNPKHATVFGIYSKAKKALETYCSPECKVVSYEDEVDYHRMLDL